MKMKWTIIAMAGYKWKDKHDHLWKTNFPPKKVKHYYWEMQLRDSDEEPEFCPYAEAKVQDVQSTSGKAGRQSANNETGTYLFF